MNNFEIEMLERLEQSHWWFLIRRKIISDWVETIPKSHILDVGSGVGGNTMLLMNLGFKVSSVEKTVLGVNIQKSKGINAILGDICSLPFPNSLLDSAICLDVLEHVFDDDRAIKELFRVMGKGGRLLISVPEDPEMFSEFDKKVLHHRRYNKDLIVEKIELAGFVIDRVWSTNWLLKPIVKWLRVRGYFENLKELNPFLNFLLFWFSRFDYICSSNRVSGMTLWICAHKPEASLN